MKATKCPAKEKKKGARKAKKEGRRETKSKSQACCVASKTRTMTHEFFSGVLFAPAIVASITAMIFFHIILHPAVLMYHIFVTSIALLLSFYSL